MKQEETNFFGDGLKFWIGKVVSKKAQKQQLDGKGWGWRYKVRIFGTYSENDNVPDDQVHNATVLFGVTDGSGFAGRLKSCKIAQHDLVFGFFMAEDECYPVIIGLLSPTKAYNKFVEKKMNGGSGFTKDTTETQNGKQEFSEQNQINTASVNADNENKVGSGEGREVQENLINSQLGDDIDNQQTNSIPNPSGFQNFDFSGFSQGAIQSMVGEAESFTNSIKNDIPQSADVIKQEAPLIELKETPKRLTPNVNNIQTGTYLHNNDTATITKTGSKDGIVGHGLSVTDTVKATWNNDFGSFYPVKSIVDSKTFTVSISSLSAAGIVSFTKTGSTGITTSFNLYDLTSGDLKGLKGF